MAVTKARIPGARFLIRTISALCAGILVLVIGSIFEIHFKKNSAELSDESRRGLDELGEVLASNYLETRFILGGHTDLDGTEAINQPLSQARAESARAYLVEEHDIASDRIVAEGFGTSEPLYEIEKSPEHKLYNRRVDLRPVRNAPHEIAG